ncbi:hypothetical protein DPSP01_005283 [Paraphaeosphaeria sporulosa]
MIGKTVLIIHLASTGLMSASLTFGLRIFVMIPFVSACQLTRYYFPYNFSGGMSVKQGISSHSGRFERLKAALHGLRFVHKYAGLCGLQELALTIAFPMIMTCCSITQPHTIS